MTADLTARITEILTSREVYIADIHTGESMSYVIGLIAQAAEEHYRPRIETPVELDELPDGAIYVSDSHQNTPEVRWDGVWYAMTSDAFEPDLPGTAVWSPGAGE